MQPSKVNQSEDSVADVIVIGAGLSGLTTARKLQGKGLKVIVLEARDRPGGRLHTVTVPNTSSRNGKPTNADLGASYVGSNQRRVMELIQEFGLETYSTNELEDLLYFEKNKWKRFTSVFPPAENILSWLDTNCTLRLIENMCEQVPLEAPWAAAKAAEWDRMTFREFIDNTVWTKAGRFIVEDTVRLNIAADPHEVSLLFVLYYLKTAGGIHMINATEGGAQEMKIVGGTQQLSLLLADKIGKENILLNHPVVKIDQTGKNIFVTTIGNNIFKCQHVVVSTPLSLQLQISFAPELPPSRTQLIQRVPMGCVMKAFLYYEAPFWKENGFCGSANINDKDSLVNYTMDNSNSDGSSPALVAFIMAENARRAAQMTEEQRKQHIVQLFAKVFQSQKALFPTAYVEKDWSSEQYSGGCYCVALPPGVLTSYGEILRIPVGRVFFAGTETATEWMGYMEGAIQSGERAAQQVLKSKGMLSEDDILDKKNQTIAHQVPRLNMSFLERHAPSLPTFFVVTAFFTLGVALIWKTNIIKVLNNR